MREDIAIVFELAPGLKKVNADPGQIEQVLVNLVVNGRDAMPSGGKIIIETANARLDDAYAIAHPYVKAGDFVSFSVTDTGSGIAPDVKSRIFEPFFTTKEKGKGTGLGLSTVYGIVKQSGGHIEVYSELGIGTTFKIYLPVVEGVPATISSGGLTAIASRGKESILLVEDEDGVRQLAHELLAECGYTVIDAKNGNEALAAVEQHAETIHLLISDVVMPEMSGPQLVERILKRRPDIRYLFMSGYTDHAVFQNELLNKGAAFIQKPFNTSAFSKKVREVLDKAV